MTPRSETVAVTGGAGYVGSVLVPALLARGYRVRVLDLFLFGRDTLPTHPALSTVDGDVRDPDAVERCVRGAGAVVHLAAVSNDPSCVLAPRLALSVNVEGSRTVVAAARRAGAGMFVYASSASVYGVADGRPVDETAQLHPITEYGLSKRLTEEHLREVSGPAFRAVALRPAALYGYAPRLRLDLTVNMFTNQAVNRREVTVFGGTQLRPVLHVADLCRLVVDLLDGHRAAAGLSVFNVAADNRTVAELAARVVEAVNARRGPGWASVTTTPAPPDDRRSYAIDSGKAARLLGFTPRLAVGPAVAELCDAFDRGQVPDPLDSDRYVNVQRLKRMLDSDKEAAG